MGNLNNPGLEQKIGNPNEAFEEIYEGFRPSYNNQTLGDTYGELEASLEKIDLGALSSQNREHYDFMEVEIEDAGKANRDFGLFYSYHESAVSRLGKELGRDAKRVLLRYMGDLPEEYLSSENREILEEVINRTFGEYYSNHESAVSRLDRIWGWDAKRVLLRYMRDLPERYLSTENRERLEDVMDWHEGRALLSEESTIESGTSSFVAEVYKILITGEPEGTISFKELSEKMADKYRQLNERAGLYREYIQTSLKIFVAKIAEFARNRRPDLLDYSNRYQSATAQMDSCVVRSTKEVGFHYMPVSVGLMLETIDLYFGGGRAEEIIDSEAEEIKSEGRIMTKWNLTMKRLRWRLERLVGIRPPRKKP